MLKKDIELKIFGNKIKEVSKTATEAVIDLQEMYKSLNNIYNKSKNENRRCNKALGCYRSIQGR